MLALGIDCGTSKVALALVDRSGAPVHAAAQAHLGRLDEARRSIEALRTLRPEIDLSFARDYWPIADANALEYLLDGLRKAGLHDV